MKMLDEYTLKNLAEVLDASFAGEDARFRGVSTDTRSIEKDDVFVALKGPNFDAHDYLDQAKDKGAIAAVVNRQVNSPMPQIKVADTHAALAQMASARRNAFNGKVIGITGSNGKTTVKELIASVLELDGKVLATKGNFNNDIGLPLTLLRLENNEKFAVIEMGANHPGEIDYLTHIASPNIALITNAGAAHLEGFGSVEGVAKAKGEIFKGLREGGTAIINLDDNYSDYWLSVSAQFAQKTFSLSRETADVYASALSNFKGGSCFLLHIKGQGNTEIKLPLVGLHNVANALLAATVADTCGISLANIKAGLENFKKVKGRLNFLPGKGGAVVIDDTYNANLDSCKAAINVLSEQTGEKYFVFGDLFESGENAQQIHQAVGEYARVKGIDHFLAVGEMSQLAVEKYGTGARHFNNKNELSEYLMPRLNQNTVVLVKGSRGMKMEEIVACVIEESLESK